MATRLNVVNPPLREARNDLIYPPRADFRWDFTSSIIPQQSMGVISFTRATTATVTDNEWVIRNCLSGEARFQWARRVQNWFPYSQELTNASWQKQELNVTLSSERVNNIPVYTLTDTAVNNVHYIRYSYSHIAGNKYMMSATVKAWTLSYVQLAPPGGISFEYANFDLSNGTITGGNTSQATINPVSGATGYYRISLYYTSLITGSQVTWLIMIDSPTAPRVQTYIGTGKTILATALQIEDITGQSISLPAEYVSTNVLTATPYHGANVDGVKYFDTDVNWVAIPKTTLKWLLAEWARTNLLLQSEAFQTSWAAISWSVSINQATAPDGLVTMDKIIPAAASLSHYLSQWVTTSASVYTYSIYAKASGYNYLQLWASASISSWYVNFDLSNGTVWGSWTWTGSIQSIWNGIYRCIAVTDTVLAATASMVIWVVSTPTSARSEIWTADGTSGILVWWAQFEQWRNASSYIPTTTTTATRNIDSLIMDTTNSVNKYGACSFIYTLEDNEQFDRRAFWLTGNTTNRLQLQVKRAWLSGANLFYWDGAGVPSVTPWQDVWANNVVIAWTNLSNVSLYMNNTKYNSGVAPNLIFTTVDIGSAGFQSWFWCIKNVRIWKTRPTDAELLALSNSSY